MTQGGGYRERVTIDDVAGQRFRPVPSEVSACRRYVRSVLTELAADPGGHDLVDLLVLTTSELATNAVLHGRTDFSVRVRVSDTQVRIEVSDGNTRMPQPCLTPADATTGRGLAIIDGSGFDWGAERHDGGKTVWVRARRKTR
jgi:anti-sigma regulatory factor (Ser/Thr protein kinase)